MTRHAWTTSRRSASMSTSGSTPALSGAPSTPPASSTSPQATRRVCSRSFAGRTGKVYADWIAAQQQGWREAIRVATLDPFRGYSTALCTQIPDATRVLDAFHVVALAVRVVDEVRRRVQQHTTGHRGHKDDPLYRVRRLLRAGAEQLTDDTRARLDAALQAGDPDLEVTIAWHCYQRLRCHLPPPRPGGRARASRKTARPAAHLPDPGDRPSGPHPALVAGRVPRLLRYRRRQQRAHRGDQPAHRKDPPHRPRIPQLRQLSASATAALRRHLAHSTHATNPEPLSTFGGVEPH